MKHLIVTLMLTSSSVMACLDPTPFLEEDFTLSFQGQALVNGSELQIYTHSDGRWVAVYATQTKRCLAALGLNHRSMMPGGQKV